MVAKFSENESWSGIEPAVVNELLHCFTESRSPLDTIALGPFSFAIFAVRGWLVSAFPLPEGAAWNDFLDEIESEIEART